MKNLAARRISKSGRPKRHSREKMRAVMLEEMAKVNETRNTLGGQCLKDEHRTLDLMEIVENATEEGATAIDLGAGCGPLSFAFLNAGGGKVVAIEQSEELCRVLVRSAARLGFNDRLEIIESNIFDWLMSYYIPKKVDFVLAELIGTGLLSEPMVKAMRFIRAHVGEDTVFIPEKAVSTLTLCNASGVPISDPEIFDVVDMRTIDRDGVDAIISFRARADVPGEITSGSLLLKTELHYPGGQTTGEYRMLCNGVPFEVTDEHFYATPFKVRDGDNVIISLKYEYGREALLAQLVSINPAVGKAS
ncbi:MAG: hypothetical protein ABII71_04750 [Candidatus Micrarchaeota archaeon]